MTAFKIVAGALLSIVVMVAIVFGLSYAGIAFTGFFGPKQAAVQQKVFVNSQPYVQGAAQDLAKEKLELTKTKDPAARQAIIQYLLENYGQMNPNLLSNPELRDFLVQIQNGEIK